MVGVSNGCTVKRGTLIIWRCSWYVLFWIELVLSLGLDHVKEMPSSRWYKDTPKTTSSKAHWLHFCTSELWLLLYNINLSSRARKEVFTQNNRCGFCGGWKTRISLNRCSAQNYQTWRPEQERIVSGHEDLNITGMVNITRSLMLVLFKHMFYKDIFILV